MSIQKRQLINNETGAAFVPIGHTEATYDANGNTVEQRLTEETQGRQAADIDLQRDVAELQDTTARIDEGMADLAVTDESGNAIVEFKNGHLRTKFFNSANVTQTGEGFEDFTIEDESGNVLVEFSKGHIKTKYFDSSNITNGKKIKILSIGNSFSYDAFSYLPPLLEDIADMDVTFGILFTAGCSLAQHLDKLENDTNYDNFSRYSSATGQWVQSYMTPTPSACIASEDWDLIILQQNSESYRPSDAVPAGYDPYAVTIEPYLGDIIDLLMGMARNARIAWLLTPSRTQDMDSTFAKTATCAQNIVRDTIIDVVFPCGTAIHNARHTSLDSLGDYAQGGHLTYDGAHLQEGVPCLIESYAAALKILELTGFGEKGIVGNLIRPNSTWLAEKSVIGQNGSPVGVGDSVWEDNRILAQKCAIWAVKKPYEITENIEPSNT